jgi:transposase
VDHGRGRHRLQPSHRWHVPLLTNDRALTTKEVLEARKRQPALEKRFEQLKSVFEIAPVLLKNEGRIEAFFFLYFLALLIQALIERELRLAMQQQKLADLPLYPEERPQCHPTCEQVLRLFSATQRSVLLHDGRTLRAFPPELTELQRQVLQLLGVPESAYQ